MPADPAALVHQLSAESLAGFPGSIFELVADDLVFVDWDGHLYVGYEGMAAWFSEQLRTWANIGFEQTGSRVLPRGWVYTTGDIVYEDREGQARRQPSHWLARIKDEKIAVVLWFRTREQAEQAHGLGGGGDAG